MNFVVERTFRQEFYCFSVYYYYCYFLVRPTVESERIASSPAVELNQEISPDGPDGGGVSLVPSHGFPTRTPDKNGICSGFCRYAVDRPEKKNKTKSDPIRRMTRGRYIRCGRRPLNKTAPVRRSGSVLAFRNTTRSL